MTPHQRNVCEHLKQQLRADIAAMMRVAPPLPPLSVIRRHVTTGRRMSNQEKRKSNLALYTRAFEFRAQGKNWKEIGELLGRDYDSLQHNATKYRHILGVKA